MLYTKSCFIKICEFKLMLQSDKETYTHRGKLGHPWVNWDTAAGKLGRMG